MKFLCDVMLSRLGRWLRAAGYDTMIAEAGQADRELLQRAIREWSSFHLLDRKLLEYRDAERWVTILNSNKINESIQETGEVLGIDWLYCPFSRCLLCNTPFVEAKPDKERRLPDGVRESDSKVFYCAECDQTFWQGGHVARMHKKLADWNSQTDGLKHIKRASQL